MPRDQGSLDQATTYNCYLLIIGGSLSNQNNKKELVPGDQEISNQATAYNCYLLIVNDLNQCICWYG